MNRPHCIEPWQPVSDAGEASGLESELRRELAPTHALYGCPVAAVARRADCDDVLFRLLDGTTRYAVVHLTWRGRVEPAPWPIATLYSSAEDWKQRRMKPDHEAFSSES